MSRLLQGDEGFKYAYRTVRRDLPVEDLARVSGAGTLWLCVDHYEVVFEDGESEMLFLEQLEGKLGLPEELDRGLYEAEEQGVTVKQLWDRLLATERKNTVPALRAHFADRKPADIRVRAEVRYRLCEDDQDAMLSYLNRKLPEGAGLTMEELRGFTSECLQEFDPDLHEPNREDGTGFLMYFLEHEEDACLPYLGFRVLVHAVEHELEELDVEDEPRWRTSLWTADGDEEEAPPAGDPGSPNKRSPAAKKAKAPAAKRAKAPAAKRAKAPAAGRTKA